MKVRITKEKPLDDRWSRVYKAGTARVHAVPYYDKIGLQCDTHHNTDRLGIFAPEWYSDMPLTHRLACEHIRAIMRFKLES